MLGELRRTTAAYAQRLEDPVTELEPAIERRQVMPVGWQDLAVDPDMGRALAVAHATSSPPIAPSGPRALATVSSHSAAGSLPQVMPPPTCSVSRRPSATNVRMRMLVCIAPSGPIQPSAPGVRPAADRLESFEELHRPDLRRPGDGATGESGDQEVEGVTTRRHPPGDGRDEVLDGRRPFQAAEARHPDGAGDADPAKVVAQDVDDHHVLGPVLGAGEELTGERPVLGAVAPPRSGALDRVRRDGSVRVERQERLRRRGQQRSRPACLGRGAEVQERREQRRVAGAQAAIAIPWVAVVGRFESTGQVRLVEVAAGDVVADPLDSGLVRGARERRAELQSLAFVGVVGWLTSRRGRRLTWRGGSGEPRVDVVESPGQAATVSVQGTPGEPGMPGPSIPCHDPVVECQAQRRQPLVVGRDIRQPFEHVAQVVAEEPDEPAEEPGRVRRHDRRRLEPGEQPPRDRERVRAGGRRLEHGHRIGRQVGPARVPAGAGALEQGETRQVAERLGGVDGSGLGDAIRQPAQSERRGR